MKRTLCDRCKYPLTGQEWDHYDINAALATLRLHPRASVRLARYMLNVSSIQSSVRSTQEHIGHVDARRPCIAIPSGARWRIIDGNHRAAKLLRAGRQVRAYLLTSKEADSIHDVP